MTCPNIILTLYNADEGRRLVLPARSDFPFGFPNAQRCSSAGRGRSRPFPGSSLEPFLERRRAGAGATSSSPSSLSRTGNLGSANRATGSSARRSGPSSNSRGGKHAQTHNVVALQDEDDRDLFRAPASSLFSSVAALEPEILDPRTELLGRLRGAPVPPRTRRRRRPVARRRSPGRG
jgi:hypothetical protein